MSDMVERLRNSAMPIDSDIDPDLIADEIGRKDVAIAELVGALDYIARRLQVDIDDGSRPDQWSMEAIVNKAKALIAKHDTTKTKEKE